MGEKTKILAWAVSYDFATKTVCATMEDEKQNQEFIYVELSNNGAEIIEDLINSLEIETHKITDTNYVIKNGHSVIFWNAEHIGPEEDDYKAEYMLFI
jgi:hypothetical protein